MGFGYILAGLFFLANPNINVFDVLPDCIGFFLIYRGLRDMSFASENLREARSLVGKLALVTLAHTFSVVLFPLADGDSFYLLLVFVFAVLETMYLIPAISRFFSGLYDLGRRFDADSVFLPVKNAKDGAERLRVFTVVFVLIKNVGAVLPELTALQSSGLYASTSRRYVFLSEFKPLFYGFSALIVLVFGVIWLIRSVRYVRLMKNDSVLRTGIDTYYRENVGNNPALLAALTMKKVRLFLLFSAVCSAVFVIDGLDVIPNALSAIFLCAAFLLMLRYDPLCWAGVAASILAAILSVWNLTVQIPFYSEYEAMSARYIATAAEMYKTVRIGGTVEYVVMLLLYGGAFILLCRVLKRHAALLDMAGDHQQQYRSEDRRRELLHTVYAHVLSAAIAGVLYFGLGIASFTASMYISEFFLIQIVVWLVWVAAVYRMTASAYENIYERLEMNY